MELFTVLALITLFHAMINFIDKFLKSCMNIPYLMFLENLGISIQPFQIHVFSTSFNRLMTKCGLNRKTFFNIWFRIGAVLVILLLIPSVLMLLASIYIQIQEKTPQKSQQILQPIVPGYNLPIGEFPYYFLTLLVSSVVHEVGHALAAVREDVHINGFGFMLLYILPGAYVDLSSEGVRSLTPFKQLKIFCAGVWHNIVLSVVALLAGFSLPYIFHPTYFHNNGILALNLEKTSPLHGPKGLLAGDVVTSLNGCPVSSIDQLRDCLMQKTFNEQDGFCVPEDIINEHDETINHAFAHPDGSIECCSSEETSNLCFELKQDESEDDGETPMHPYSCLPARIAVTSSASICKKSSDCPKEGYHCLAPSFKNSSRLLHVQTYSLMDPKMPPKNLLYLGYPADIYYTVTYTNYIPKYSFLSHSLPNNLEILADYFVKFSGGLAILNLIPCFYLDGYRIAGSLIDLSLSKYLDSFSRRLVHSIVTIFGTTLLTITLGIGVSSLL